MERCKLYLKPGKEKSLYRKHPWLFSGAIAKMVGKPQEGDLVDIYDADKQHLATGHFQDETIIAKILEFGTTAIDYDFWKQRIANAINYRKGFGFFDNPDTNVFRLINGEGDFMPGLIADYYNGIVVLQAHSQGMHNNFQTFADILAELLTDKLVAVFDKSSSTLPRT